MDPSIKQYADSLYEKALADSAITVRRESTKYLEERSKIQDRNQLFSGIDYQAHVRIYANHIERSTAARLDSYQKAFSEINRSPREGELREILDDFKATWELQIKQSTQALSGFLAARNAPAGFDLSGNLRADTAQGHDRVLQEWKIWRGRVLLRKSTPNSETRSQSSVQQRIAAYADRAYAAANHNSLHQTSLKIAETKSRLASRGIILSGATVQEIAKLQGEHINTVVQAKADALLDAYELYGIEIDDSILREATALRGTLVDATSTNPSSGLPPGVPAFEMFRPLLETNTGAIINTISCQIEQRKVTPKFTRSERRTNATPLSGGLDERHYALMAIEEALKSVPEDERPHPKVGAVVVKNGVVLSKAHRGEILKSHAEYIALDDKLSDDVVAGATVYTTLEPCTTRKHPKIPCAQRLIDRKVVRVVIGMLDPNPDIRGRGDQLLSDAGIEIQLFPRDLRAQVEDMNREFIRSQKDRQATAKMPTTDEDQSSWPDVILECQWPSLLHEPKIPGSHTVRKRPWMLRHRDLGAVYNVHIRDLDFGAYKASFPFPVATLIDTASVYPIICRKSDGEVISIHDLESLIQNPPPECDVQQYAVETDDEDEEIRLEGFVREVEIPVMISYDGKNGNRFKIKYLLHYDTYTEKGEMIRIGGIEKVAPK